MDVHRLRLYARRQMDPTAQERITVVQVILQAPAAVAVPIVRGL